MMSQKLGFKIEMPTNITDGLRRWSASVVEHLRTVHLLLLVTSVGLILVTLSAKSYEPTKALTQLEEIQRLQKDWSPEFLYDQIMADRLPAEAKGSLGEVTDWAFVPAGAPHSFRCWAGNHEFECKPDQNWRAHFHAPWSPAAFPKTIAEFTEFWDSLGNEVQWVDFVDQVGEGTVKGTIPAKIVVAGIDEAAMGGRAQPALNAEHQSQKPLWLIPIGDGLVFWDAPMGENYSWTIPVLTYRRCPIDQKALGGMVRTWKPGKFESTFHDLARASENMKELEFADVRKQLEGESAGGSELFEVAGLKIPSEQLRTVGIIAVLGIQLYLLILLRELSHKLHLDDSGWDVPWIGMFSSPLAQFATWLSVIVCPIIAVVFLALHGYRQYVPGTDPLYRGLRHPAALLYAASPVISCVLAWFSWIYQPKMVAPLDIAKAEASVLVEEQ